MLSNFSEMTVKLPSSECNWNLLMTSQHWFRWWLGAFRQQNITSANVDPDLCHHMVSLGHNELIHWEKFTVSFSVMVLLKLSIYLNFCYLKVKTCTCLYFRFGDFDYILFLLIRQHLLKRLMKFCKNLAAHWVLTYWGRVMHCML